MTQPLDGTRRVTRTAVLRLAVPIVFANIGVSLSGLADTAVMGRMAEPVFLSATAIGATLFSTLYWAFGFLRMSTGGLVAQAFGARDTERQRRTVLRAVVLAMSIGIVALMAREPLLTLGLSAMHDANGLHALVGDYFRIRLWSAPAVLVLFVLHGALVGRQSMGVLLTVQLLQTGLNVALNIAFFSFTDLDVRGVALATVIADVVAVAVALAWLAPVLRGDVQTRAPMARWLLERSELARLLSIGGDLFVRSLCLTTMYFWFTATGTRLGISVIAVNAILMQLLQFTSFFLDGFAHAAEALVGEAIGQRSRTALHRAVRASAELGIGMAVLLAAFYLVAGGAFVDLMTTDPSIRTATRYWLGWAVALPIAGVGSFLLDGIFIGATRTRVMRDSMIVVLVLFLIATQLLVPAFGNHGLWAAFFVMLIGRAIGLGLALPQLMRDGVSPLPGPPSAATSQA